MMKRNADGIRGPHRGGRGRRTLTFEDLDGKRFGLYGVDGNCFRLRQAGGVPFTCEAVEDPNDGYRSCLEKLRLVPPEEAKKLVFFHAPVATVAARKSNTCDDHTTADAHDDMLEFVDDEGHVWLRVGTHHDGYYPCFVFSYSPRE